MKGSPQLKNLRHRVEWLLLIMFIYCLGMAIPLPFVRVTARYTHVLQNSSLGLLSLMGGSNYNQITLFSIGINPMMISMILVQLLQMGGILGFDALSQRQINWLQQLLTLIFAAIQGMTIVWGLHLIPHHDIEKIASAVLILTTGAMFVTWLGSMNSKKGIGGMITLILINISVGMVPRIQSAIQAMSKMNHPVFLIVGLLVLSLALVYFWIAFSYAYYPIPLIQMTLPSYSKPLTLPIGLNSGAMMTFMMGMALITLPMMAGQVLQIPWLLNPWFNVIYSSVVTFALFYFFTFMQFNPKEQAKMMRNQNNYILDVRPGLPTQKYLTKRLVWVSLPGAILNTFQMVFGIVGVRYLGSLGSIAFLPMIIVMIVMFMFGIKDMILIMLVPHEYEKMMKKEG